MLKDVTKVQNYYSIFIQQFILFKCFLRICTIMNPAFTTLNSRKTIEQKG